MQKHKNFIELDFKRQGDLHVVISLITVVLIYAEIYQRRRHTLLVYVIKIRWPKTCQT